MPPCLYVHVKTLFVCTCEDPARIQLVPEVLFPSGAQRSSLDSVNSTVLYYTILYNTILYYTTLCHTILYYTILYYTILYYTILYYTILYYTILYYTILYYTILYYTILYYTILYYTILYYTILYYTILYYTILYYTILYYTILYYTHKETKACEKALLLSFFEGLLQSCWLFRGRYFGTWFCSRAILQSAAAACGAQSKRRFQEV